MQGSGGTHLGEESAYEATTNVTGTKVHGNWSAFVMSRNSDHDGERKQVGVAERAQRPI